MRLSTLIVYCFHTCRVFSQAIKSNKLLIVIRKFPPLKAAKISPTYTVAPSSLTFTHYRIADDVDPNHVNLRMTGSQSPCPSYAASTLNSTASSELSTRSRRPDNYFLSSQEIGRQMETKTPQLPDYWRNYPPIRR
eukprot:TRINITY_DN191_c0_g1_i7.p1 TRINITY_DN191_c0_g1~~TRINITY_DN191_c0_g1_i7.p1  ORF type:complete len:136 (-),score=2.33 TRINITY_DN191_c0_g1_i7:309-716(-)